MSRFTLDLKCGSFLMILLLLVGCSTLKIKEFDKTANIHIKKIALLRIDEPKITVGRCGTGTGLDWGGGILGAFIGSSINKARSNAFLQALNDHHIQFGPAMVEALRQELTKKGYKFVYLQDQSPMPASDDKTDYYSHVQTDADAILFVGIWDVGYVAPIGFSTDYEPNMHVYATLVDTRSKRVIYINAFYMGELNITNTEIMAPDDKYKYNSFDTLMENINEAAQGIIDCQNKIAARIAEQLK